MTSSIEDQFKVVLHDDVVGRLHRKGDVTRFAFEDGYWLNPSRSVLGLSFENQPVAPHRSHIRLPTWFSNLLPESSLFRQWIADARRVSIRREMELLAQVGHDLPGAVRVVATDAVVPIDISGDLESFGRNKNHDDVWRFSLAGVGLKFSMAAKGGKLTIPSIGNDGDWIVKLPDLSYEEVPRNELAMMSLAAKLGMSIPEIRLVHRDQVDSLPDRAWLSGENWAYAIKRFDRETNGGRVHIEDMAQVRGFYPEDKYVGSFETVAALVYRNRHREDLREFSRRLAFCAIIGAGDAHLKNWSLIYRDRRNPQLSPAYDLVSTFLYRPKDGGPEEMALRFGRSKSFNDISLNSFVRLDKILKAEASLGDVVRQMAGDILSNWEIVDDIFREKIKFSRSIRDFVEIRLKDFE